MINVKISSDLVPIPPFWGHGITGLNFYPKTRTRLGRDLRVGTLKGSWCSVVLSSGMFPPSTVCSPWSRAALASSPPHRACRPPNLWNIPPPTELSSAILFSQNERVHNTHRLNLLVGDEGSANTTQHETFHIADLPPCCSEISMFQWRWYCARIFENGTTLTALW